MKEQSPAPEEVLPETKPERRERKRQKRRARMLKHGKGLARVYKDAVVKRAAKPE